MLLAACTWIDTELTLRLEPAVADSLAWMRERRIWLAVVVLVTSVLDLLLTQTLLALAEQRADLHLAEANPFMAPVVMSWWAWPLRVGIPLLAVVRDMRAGRYGLVTVAAALYGAVVVWNTHLLVVVQTT